MSTGYGGPPCKDTSLYGTRGTGEAPVRFWLVRYLTGVGGNIRESPTAPRRRQLLGRAVPTPKQKDLSRVLLAKGLDPVELESTAGEPDRTIVLTASPDLYG